MTTTTPTYYGFQSANRGEQPAWFHTPEDALNFAHACGFTAGEDQRPLTLDDIETTTEANPEDIADETGFGSPTTPTHTPGPWLAQINNCHHAVISPDGFDVATISANAYESAANARLIAAAPDLLAELKECRRRLATLRVYDCAVFDQQPHGTLRSVSYDGKLADLIAKAEGRS